MSSQHNIETISDIFLVVNESNIDGFLQDFEHWLRIMVELKKLNSDAVTIGTERFGWNDDGDYGTAKSLHVDIRIKDEQKGGE